jgi:hypothetical protein
MSTVTDPRPAVKQRKPRAKPQRFCRLDGKPEIDAPAILTLHVAGKETDYFIRPVPSNFGEAFELTKLEIVDDGPAERGEVYHVLFEDEHNHTCECKGFLRWGHCKHVDSLKALRERGKI